MAVKREKIKFESVEQLLGAPITSETTVELEINHIRPFKSHPFKVIDDSRMEDLVKSISLNGVLTPVIVREIEEPGQYEMISGHRRMHAAKLAGLRTIPAVIKKFTDEEATIAMVDANVQREEILPSERAFSLKMKMEALNSRQGKRTDLTCGNDCHKLEEAGTKSRAIVGKDAGMSERSVQNYIKLTELVPEVMDLVDQKKIGVTMGVDVAGFDKELQGWIYEYFRDNNFLKPVQIQALKDTPNLENIAQRTVIQIMNDALPDSNSKANGKVTLSEKKLNKYFPPHFSSKQREMVIVGLLEKWHEEQK
ncbi:ParB/RepB/Spo0J family partition protein [Butyrivibrio sp. AE2032]|jgi:ParB family chromosome partitioning protein|uniref:ParB/RepB/Spo0J family partition protein n=1 Tax=Butyrivibrio sp. AE2032 TaxID=1458463 RepID=UPI0005524299|nr:ParB/RepB/Spo0J family partition protein [Butyrivibrio sp. AE2032]